MIFVDTNYFLRFLVRDVEEQYQVVRKLFDKGVSGKDKLFTSLVVFFETYWVLSSFYQKNKQELVTKLAEVLELKFIKIKERESLEKAIKLFGHNNLSLEDAFNLVYSQKNKALRFATFDKKLSKMFEEKL